MSTEIQRLQDLDRRLKALENLDRPATKSGKSSTTDATATTLLTIALDASTTTLIEAHVVARRTGGSAGVAEDGAGYVLRGTYKVVAGSATLIGAVNADYTAEDQAGWDATLDTSGQTVRVRVTGAANNNITWYGWVQVWRASS